MSKPSRLLVTVLAATLSSLAQKSSPAPMQSPAPFPATTAKSISIVRDVLPTLPFKCGGTVRRFARPAGRKLRGVGICVKRNMRITANMQDYAIPIDVNEHVATTGVTGKDLGR